MNRLTIIIAGVLLAILIGVGVYFVFFRTSAPGLTVGNTGPLFGTSGDQVGSNPQDISTEMPVARQVAPRFMKISDGPVAHGVSLRDFSVEVSSPGETSTTTTTRELLETELLFVERATGNVYSYRVIPSSLTRITNQTVPGVVEAAWTPDGTFAFVRYLVEDITQGIQTYALSTTETPGYVLESGLSQVLTTSDNTVVTLLPSGGGSIATIAKADGAPVKTLFSSTLSKLVLQQAGDDYIAYTKASALNPGYVFLVDGATGSFERILGPVSGLTALANPSGDTLLISYRSGNALKVELVDVATRNITALPLATLVEKCVWAQDGATAYCGVPRSIGEGLPDTWYQGVSSFSDRIWKIDVENRLTALVFDPRQIAEVDIDAVSLTVDSIERSLVFINKSDGSLWLYEL